MATFWTAQLEPLYENVGVNVEWRHIHIELRDFTYRVVDIVKTLAGWEGVVWVDVLESTHRQEHSNGGAKGEECLRMKSQLRVINGHLGQESEPFSPLAERCDSQRSRKKRAWWHERLLWCTVAGRRKESTKAGQGEQRGGEHKCRSRWRLGHCVGQGWKLQWGKDVSLNHGTVMEILVQTKWMVESGLHKACLSREVWCAVGSELESRVGDTTRDTPVPWLYLHWSIRASSRTREAGGEVMLGAVSHSARENQRGGYPATEISSTCYSAPFRCRLW